MECDRRFQRDEVYVGTGVIKKIKVSRNDPNLTVILQIDCTDPLDKDKRQKTPNTKAVYENQLDFRVRYDSENINRAIKKIRSPMHGRSGQQQTTAQRLVQECIWQAVEKEPLYADNQLSLEFCYNGMTEYNQSQKAAITKACR